jgi:hypothetical protein
MPVKQTQRTPMCKIKLICFQKEVTKKAAQIYPSNLKDTEHSKLHALTNMWEKKHSVDTKVVKNMRHGVYDTKIRYSILKLHFKLYR